ncbi:Fanconi anemia group J protein, partial [Perkinsus olseni]
SEVIESVYAMTDSATSDNADWSPAASDVTATSRGHTNKTGASQKSATVHSVISSESMGWVDTSDVLLLDLRAPEDFNVAHIATAVSYPAVLLARDRILPEMAKFRTSRGLGDSKGIPASIAHEKRARVMVVYDIDDRAAKNTVTAMVQKGWDEVYLLSGGFKEFSSSYPELVDGDIDSVLRAGGGTSKKMRVPRRHQGEGRKGYVLTNPEMEAKSSMSEHADSFARPSFLDDSKTVVKEWMDNRQQKELGGFKTTWRPGGDPDDPSSS